MKKLLIVRLIIIAALGDVAKSGVYAFKWKSSSVFPNGTVVQAYVGDNVTFPWEFDMKSPKQVVIEWSKTSKNKPERRPASCVDVKKYDKVSGVHTLFVNDIPIKVYCDQKTEYGGWTVIQRRQDGSVDFYRNWEEYEKGFGDLNGEFWIGLANLHQLTKSKTVQLRVDLTDFDGSTAYALYYKFNISGADDNYRLNVDWYSGTAGDGLTRNNKIQFSTYDRDHDTSSGNCAQKNHGAWWYKYCHYSNLNGRYKSNGDSGYDGVFWDYYESRRSLKRVEMKIKK